MIRYAVTTILEERPVEKTCDKCGFTAHCDRDIGEFQEFLHVCQFGGYASVFGDMNYLQVDLCQHCMIDLLGEFARISNSNDDDVEE